MPLEARQGAKKCPLPSMSAVVGRGFFSATDFLSMTYRNTYAKPISGYALCSRGGIVRLEVSRSLTEFLHPSAGMKS